MADLNVTFNAVNILTNTSATLTVYEDVGGDGSGPNSVTIGGTTIQYENSDTVTLSDGTTSYTLTGFDGSSGNTLYPHIEPDNSDVTLTSDLTESLTLSVSITKPSAPSNLSISQGAEDQLDLTWTDNSVDEDGFYVYRAQTSGSTTADYTRVADLASNTTNYTDTGLEDGEQYFYRVSAYNTAGESNLSNEDSAITVLPSASNIDASVNANDNVDVTWTNNDDSTDGGIDVERSTDGFSTITTVASGLSPSTESYTDTSVSSDTTHEYRVERNTDHATATSGTASVTTLNQIGTARIAVGDTKYDVPIYSLDSIDTRTWLRARTADDTVGALRPIPKSGEVLRAYDPSDDSVVGVKTDQL